MTPPRLEKRNKTKVLRVEQEDYKQNTVVSAHIVSAFEPHAHTHLFTKKVYDGHKHVKRDRMKGFLRPSARHKHDCTPQG